MKYKAFIYDIIVKRLFRGIYMNKLESKEDYLERILILHKSNDIVRGIDLANSFKYSKARVSIALKKLKNLRYINVDLAEDRKSVV